VADKGYSTRKIRTYLRQCGIGHTIPERSDQIAAAAGHLASTACYKRRNIVERCFNQLKQCRGLATRYDKTATSYTAVITIACLLLWM
jgi:transposase